MGLRARPSSIHWVRDKYIALARYRARAVARCCMFPPEKFLHLCISSLHTLYGHPARTTVASAFEYFRTLKFARSLAWSCAEGSRRGIWACSRCRDTMKVLHVVVVRRELHAQPDFTHSCTGTKGAEADFGVAGATDEAWGVKIEYVAGRVECAARRSFERRWDHRKADVKAWKFRVNGGRRGECP